MKPISFNTEMVRAILDGRKTQTRRVIKNLDLICDWDPRDKKYGPYFEDEFGNSHLTSTQCPYGQPGDKLWVKETFMPETEQGIPTGGIIYKATNRPEPDGNFPLRWRSPRYMPRWASRITLEITNVRVEKVQDIIGDDVWAEGVDNGRANKKMGIRWENAQRMAFEKLWNSINKKRGYGWNQNPWVWVIEFRRV